MILSFATAATLVAGAAGAAGAAYVGVRRAARGLLRPKGRRSTRTPADLGLDGTAFDLASVDGQLRGWLLRAGDEPRPTIVVAHGWQSHAGDMLAWAAPLVRAGFHAVVYDALGHGDSDPSEFTSIRHMREDLAAVVAWTSGLELAAPGVVVVGHSMGGAAALLLAADARFPARGVITAGAPTDPLAITREWLESKHLPGAAAVSMMRRFWEPIVAEPYEGLRPIVAIADAKVPVLVLHGRRDRQVRAHHAELLAAAGPSARLVIYEDGDHWNLPKLPGYANTIAAFVGEVLRGGIVAPRPG